MSKSIHRRPLDLIAAAVDQSLPKLTRVDLSLPKTQFGKTNPTPLRVPPRTKPKDVALPPDVVARIRAATKAGLPKLTGVDPGLPNERFDKTDPTPAPTSQSRPLSARQLLAARMFMEGRSTPEIAAQLGISRQAVWKWSRNPAFRDEVRALHRMMIRRTG